MREIRYVGEDTGVHPSPYEERVGTLPIKQWFGNQGSGLGFWFGRALTTALGIRV